VGVIIGEGFEVDSVGEVTIGAVAEVGASVGVSEGDGWGIVIV
jgi:hypothetical protein